MKINRRKFMKVIAGVVAGVSILKAEENPKVSYDPRPKRATIENNKEYDLIADLVDEMNRFDKKFPETLSSYSIHCNYTGLAFLNDTGCLEKYNDEIYSYRERHGNSHIFWIPLEQWKRRVPLRPTVLMNVMVRPNLTVDLGLIAHYSSRRNITNKLEDVYTLVTTRCFNVNREDEGKIIAGLRPGEEFCRTGLVGLWLFNEGSGGQAFDLSGGFTKKD